METTLEIKINARVQTMVRDGNFAKSDNCTGPNKCKGWKNTHSTIFIPLPHLDSSIATT